MIRYKVVNGNRGSCTVPFQSHKYYRKYNKGDIIYAEEGSFGLMVFNTKFAALMFMKIGNGSILIKVRPIGKVLKRPRFIFRFSQEFRSLSFFYKLVKNSKSWKNQYMGIPKFIVFKEARLDIT